jgi:inner membrane protein
MPTIFSHAILASAAAVPLRGNVHFKKLLITGIICSMIPDADAIGFFLGIPYESLWGHRGISHSIFFSVFLSVTLTFVLFDKSTSSTWKKTAFLYLFFSTLSHPLLDALTNGGLGVALFAPFENSRYFSPWRPILVSPMGIGFLSTRGLAVLLSEFIWIWIPSLLIGFIARNFRPVKLV